MLGRHRDVGLVIYLTSGAVPLDLSQGGSQGSCQCWQQHGSDTAVFYNRVPKCGSTTMLR